MLNKLKNITNVYGYFYLKVWMLHLVVLSSLFLIDIKYVVYGLIVTFFYMPLSQLIHHEYVSHQYVQPKNKWIDLVCLFLLYFSDTAALDKYAWHINHHVKWRDPAIDPVQQKMALTSKWRYLFGLTVPLDVDVPPRKNMLLENNQWVKMFDAHVSKIFLTYIILMFIVLPLPWFFVFCIYPYWLIMMLFNLHDQLFHGKNKDPDSAWYLPIYGNAAWHIKHHEEYKIEYYGPGMWRWFNLSWYYRLLLFKPVKQ